MTPIFKTFLAILSLSSSTFAQRPSNTSVCDYYTGTILGAVTPANQKLLLTLLINTVVLGNYTTPNTGVAVHGFASPGVQDGVAVNLLPFFTGAKLTTNGGGDGNVGISKVFLDDGGPVPLQHNMTSNGTGTAQYFLLNHIYQYFGSLIGCSEQGKSDVFPAYQGEPSMWKVHRFMDITTPQFAFFTTQLVGASLSIGFSSTDAETWRTIMAPYTRRCEPAFAIQGVGSGPDLQSTCIADDCPKGSDADCAAYPFDANAVIPANATTAEVTMSASASGSSAPSATGNANGTANSGVAVGAEGSSGLQMLGMVVAAVVVSLQI